MTVCKRCNGKGYFKTIIQEGGVCYECDGLGDSKKAKEIRKLKKEESNKKWAEELKIEIASIYLKINKPSIIGGENRKAQLRKEAQEKYSILKEQFGIILTLDQIQDIAKELK